MQAYCSSEKLLVKQKFSQVFLENRQTEAAAFC